MGSHSPSGAAAAAVENTVGKHVQIRKHLFRLDHRVRRIYTPKEETETEPRVHSESSPNSMQYLSRAASIELVDVALNGLLSPAFSSNPDFLGTGIGEGEDCGTHP